MHEIYLSGLDYEQDGFRNSAIRGVRYILRQLGANASFREAKAIVDDFIETPTVMRRVGKHADLMTVDLALNTAEEFHSGAAVFAVDPDDLELADPGAPHPDDEELSGEPEPEGGPYSAAAYKTAMVLLSSVNGNPLMAYARAFQLAKATEDASLYEEVQAALMEVFELIFHSAGPNIHLIP